jgi:putative DNA primase/helicase
MAGEVAAEFGVVSWEARNAVAAASVMFQAWKSQRKAGNRERHQIIEQLADFIAKHGDSRFSLATSKSNYPTTVRDRAGWYVEHDDGRTFYFNSVGLREATTGFDFETALDVLEDAGALVPPQGGDVRSKVKRFPGHERTRVYEIDPDKL